MPAFSIPRIPVKQYIKMLFWGTALIFSSCSDNTEQQDDENITLVEVFSFPGDEDEVFLGMPTNAAFSESAIFIPDQASSVVHHFDLQGDYLGRIGRPGSGPGELSLPGRAAYRNGALWVYDIGNARYWRWMPEKERFNTFPVRYIPRSFTVGENHIYMTRLHEPDTNETGDSAFITFFDFELNRAGAFGESLTDLVSGMLPVGSAAQLNWFEDELYVLFQNYPFLHVYNKDGHLIRDIDFDQRYSEIAAANYRPEVFADPSHITLRSVFSAYDVTKEGIFIAVHNNDESLLIDQFDHSGSFLRRYYMSFDNGHSFTVRNLKILRSASGRVKFYVLGFKDDVAAVHVFTSG